MICMLGLDEGGMYIDDNYRFTCRAKKTKACILEINAVMHAARQTDRHVKRQEWNRYMPR